MISAEFDDGAVHAKFLLFAQAKELAGGLSESTLIVPREIKCSQLMDLIFTAFPSLGVLRGACIMAVDRKYCDDLEAMLKIETNTEIALIPPLSGG